MKIFIKTLLFVFITLITNPKVVLSENVAFLDIQETTTSLSFHKETPKTVFMVIENDWVNRCQNEQDFVAYRGQGAGVETVAAKGVAEITKHAAQRMAERGITQKMIETGISKGTKYLDPKNGTFNYVLKNGFASGKDLLIGVSPQTGKVTTVLRSSKNLINNRFIPIR